MGSLNPENDSKQDLDDSGYVHDASVTENGYRGYAQLLDLSDDVLLYILQYCTPRDLKALGHTCPRLGALICDRTLWTRVDARSAPVGQQRLRWLLTHCLSPATTELKLAGYANKFSRCLGIQDLHWPVEADQDFIRGACIGSAEGVDVEHFLLRMWYPHLPRFAVSPRWPDKAEADSKSPQKTPEATTSNSQKAPEATTSKSGDSSSSSGCSGQNSGNIGQNLGKSGPNSSSLNQKMGKSGQDLGNMGQNSSKSGNFDQHSGKSGQDSSNTGQNSENSESKKENDNAYPILFENDIRDDCKGPQFTLTAHLMKDLRKKCSHLSSLALEYCNIDYKTTSIRLFPSNLKKLSLRGSRCYNLPLNTSYLGKIQDRLPELEYLDVSECDWFEPASLMPLSKLAALTELYMRDCKRLTECVAYASLATRYGFRKLRVFDVRGSPLADSEVSAVGWLPCLEEFYVAPPEDFNTMTEHTHTWNDTRTTFTELDNWEIEEPDYYKIKSPEPSEIEEDDQKDEEAESERTGDMLLGNPWWSHERRIIVIQPNANRQLEEHFPFRPRQGEPDAPEEPQRPVNPRPGPAEPRPGPAEPRPSPAEPRPSPAELRPGPVDSRPGPTEPRSGPTEPRPGSADPRPGPTDPRPGPTEPRAGPVDPRPGPADPEEPGPSKRHAAAESIDLAKRRRLEEEEDEEEMQVPLPPFPINFPQMNPDQCPRLRNMGFDDGNVPEHRPRCVRFRRQEHHHHPVMHIDVDIQRQTTHIGSHDGYNLVSDSALLRFGRAENENVNYVNIGRDGIRHGPESGSRPDRSNLRILSVTGYRNITDRSLEHLATAAPHLLHIDFSDTSVTPRGVELFKAIRPNCDVIFSEFGRMT